MTWVRKLHFVFAHADAAFSKLNLFFLSSCPSQMSLNGSEQLEKAMEEVLDDDDDDVKVEKSNVEKMEKHREPKSQVALPQPPGANRLKFSNF